MLVKEYFEELKNKGMGEDANLLGVCDTHSMVRYATFRTADKYDGAFSDAIVVCHIPTKSGKGEVILAMEKYDHDTIENSPAYMKKFVYDLIEKNATSRAEAL